MKKISRQTFIRQTGIGIIGLGVSSFRYPRSAVNAEPFFEISLAEWSLHRTLREGKLDNLDFPAKAKNDFGIHAVEYVDQFFRDKAEDKGYLNELKKRTEDLGVKNVLIMIDTAGPLADSNPGKRKEAVENHYKWINAAKFLGCHSIRVNLRGDGSYDEMANNAIESLSKLSEYGESQDIGVIVENHGGYSSNGKWVVNVIEQVNNPYCGTLPDFDNFCIKRSGRECGEEYDKYQGVAEMAPYAKGFSAKTRDFDENGQETSVDYHRMMEVIKENFNPDIFRGYMGIEYSGTRLSEEEGIMASKRLLESLQY